MPTLVSPNFMISSMMCLHFFLFSVMEDKVYFIVWGIVEFKAFHASSCLTPPALIGFSHAFAFFCMYLT